MWRDQLGSVCTHILVFRERRILIFIVIFGGCVIAGAGFWILALVSAFGVMRQFKSSSDRFSKRTLWNPLNALTAPSLLTEKGLKWRHRVFIGVLGFLGCLAGAGLSILLLKLVYHHS